MGLAGDRDDDGGDDDLVVYTEDDYTWAACLVPAVESLPLASYSRRGFSIVPAWHLSAPGSPLPLPQPTLLSLQSFLHPSLP